MAGGSTAARNTRASRREFPLCHNPMLVTLVLFEHLKVEDGTSLRQESVSAATPAWIRASAATTHAPTRCNLEVALLWDIIGNFPKRLFEIVSE
jgi:hypothetical protein